MEGKNKKGKKASVSNKNATTRSSSTETSDDIKNLTEMVQTMIIDNKLLTEKVEESLRSNEFINEKFEEIKKTNGDILQKVKEITIQNKQLMEKNKILEKEIAMEKEERIKLEEKIYMILTPIELEKRAKNLELHGYTENDNENCHIIVQEVLAKITPRPVNISNCFRTGPKYSYSGEKRTRAILIKFTTQDDREIAFASRNNLRKLDNQTLFLNENLPPHLKMLRGKANKIRKEKGYKYLWMKNGNLLVRKHEESSVIGIKNMSDLEKIK